MPDVTPPLNVKELGKQIAADVVSSVIGGKPAGLVNLIDVNKDGKIDKEDGVIILKWILVSLISIIFGEFLSWFVEGISTGDFSNYQPFSNLIIDFGGTFILLVFFKSFMEKFNKDKKAVVEENTTLKDNAHKYERDLEHRDNLHEMEKIQLIYANDVKQIEIDMLKLGFDSKLANAKLAEMYPKLKPLPEDKPDDVPSES